jgi:transposase InsO family protein
MHTLKYARIAKPNQVEYTPEVIDHISSHLPDYPGYKSAQCKSTNTSDGSGRLCLFYKDKPVMPAHKIDAYLTKLYEDPSTGFVGRDKLYARVKEKYYGISKRRVEKFVANRKEAQIHHSVRKQAVKQPIVSKEPGERWQADLIDMTRYRAQNRGHRWVLTVIDTFSKFAWARSFSNKSAPLVAKKFREILTTPIKLEWLEADEPNSVQPPQVSSKPDVNLLIVTMAKQLMDMEKMERSEKLDNVLKKYRDVLASDSPSLDDVQKVMRERDIAITSSSDLELEEDLKEAEKKARGKAKWGLYSFGESNDPEDLSPEDLTPEDYDERQFGVGVPTDEVDEDAIESMDPDDRVNEDDTKNLSESEWGLYRVKKPVEWESNGKISRVLAVPPKILQTDGGSEFKNPFESVLHKFGIKHVISNPYKPTSQGQIERWNGTLKALLRKYMTMTKGGTFSTALQRLVHNYNTSVHRTTGHRPIDVHLGLYKDVVQDKILDSAKKMVEDSHINLTPVKVGDKVRVLSDVHPDISRNKWLDARKVGRKAGEFTKDALIRKSRLPNYSEELFEVVNVTPPHMEAGQATLRVKRVDGPHKGEIVNRIFFRDEVLKVDMVNEASDETIAKEKSRQVGQQQTLEDIMAEPSTLQGRRTQGVSQDAGPSKPLTRTATKATGKKPFEPEKEKMKAVARMFNEDKENPKEKRKVVVPLPELQRRTISVKENKKSTRPSVQGGSTALAAY